MHARNASAMPQAMRHASRRHPGEGRDPGGGCDAEIEMDSGFRRKDGSLVWLFRVRNTALA